MSRHREIIDRRLRAHYGVFWRTIPANWQDMLDVWEDALGGMSEQTIRDAFSAAARRCAKPEDLTPATVVATVQSGPASVAQIIEAVADEASITPGQIRGHRRTNEIARPRQVAMYLARAVTDLSWGQIGKAFGGKDHTTVMHACRRVEALMATDGDLARTVSNCKARLGVTL